MLEVLTVGNGTIFGSGATTGVCGPLPSLGFGSSYTTGTAMPARSDSAVWAANYVQRSRGISLPNRKFDEVFVDIDNGPAVIDCEDP